MIPTMYSAEGAGPVAWGAWLPICPGGRAHADNAAYRFGAFDARMTDIADAELVSRIAAGDRLAFRTLFGRHQVRVHRFITSLVRDAARAEDLTNDVFLDVWKQAGKFEGRSTVSTWLLGIARFKALSQRRRRTEAELDDETAEGVADESDTPEISVAKLDKGAALRACINALSVEHKEVVDLVYYHEKSIEEVAEIVGIPEATVKTRMFYARKKLADMMTAQGLDRGWP